MKRNTIALSVAAAFGGFVLAGGAQAQSLVLNPQGVGHIAVVPYFSAQGGNATLLTLTNTDTTNGKAVKIRFRSALNSDDLFDFQVFLSPGDVWTASVSAPSATAPAQFFTSDNSCTLPVKAELSGASFITQRLNQELTAEQLASQTREGYIEILNMGDIAPSTATGSLFATIKHATSGTAIGTAPCSTSILASIPSYVATTTPTSSPLSAPTTGLMADWIVINVPNSLTYSGDATVLELQSMGAPAAGNIVYSPQTSTPVVDTGVTPSNFSADPLWKANIDQALSWDFPDLSTPYSAGLTAQQQANNLSAALASVRFAGSFLTNPAIQSKTDWVLSMPTRRYYAAVDYEGDGLITNYDDFSVTTATMFRKSSGTLGGNLRGDGLAAPVCVRLDKVTFYNQEELPTTGNNIGISPGTAQLPEICGEVAVFSINGTAASPTGVMNATVATQLLSVPATGTKFIAGWGVLESKNPTTFGGTVNQGLPIIGRSFVSARNPAVTTGGFYGSSSSVRKVQ